MSAEVVCIGTTLVDELFFCSEKVIVGTSNPAAFKRTIGGVMSNIVQHLNSLNVSLEFITVLGNDTNGLWISNFFKEKNISIKHSLIVSDATGKYIAIHNEDGSLHTAACFDEGYRYITPDFLESKSEVLKSARFIVCDTNINAASIQWLINFSRRHEVNFIIEPVSVIKARKLSDLNVEGLYMLTPNEDELLSLSTSPEQDHSAVIKMLLDKGVMNIWVRKGSNGSELFQPSQSHSLPVPIISVKDSTGAGDAALAAWIWAQLKQYDVKICMEYGHSLALEVLQQEGAVLEDLTEAELQIFKEKYYPNV